MVQYYINMPSQVIRIVKLKPSSDMNPKLRCRKRVGLSISSWNEDRAHPQDWLFTKVHKIRFITVNGSSLPVMDLFRHSTRSVRQLMVIFHFVSSDTVVEGLAKGVVNLLKLLGNMPISHAVGTSTC